MVTKPIIFMYNEIPFVLKEDAISAANRHLREVFEDCEGYYIWADEPVASPTVPGLIWRGSTTFAGMTFTADVIQKTVE